MSTRLYNRDVRHDYNYYSIRYTYGVMLPYVSELFAPDLYPRYIISVPQANKVYSSNNPTMAYYEGRCVANTWISSSTTLTVQHNSSMIELPATRGWISYYARYMAVTTTNTAGNHTTPTATAQPNSDAGASSSHTPTNKDLDAGTVAGVVLGVIIVLSAIVGLFIFWRWRMRKSSNGEQSSQEWSKPELDGNLGKKYESSAEMDGSPVFAEMEGSKRTAELEGSGKTLEMDGKEVMAAEMEGSDVSELHGNSKVAILDS
jgi:hypothetical protein